MATYAAEMRMRLCITAPNEAPKLWLSGLHEVTALI